MPVPSRGYGHALMGGIAAARGHCIIMGDADDSYDFLEIPAFVEKLREGFALVQGCRLPSGGGAIMPGAMPFLHRWCGNPLFSRLARWWFKVPVHDVYCGLRGFTKALYQRLDQRCTGMEFATEMIIKASLYQTRCAEIPITLHPDGRKAHPPPQNVSGWLAYPALFPDVQSALVVFDARPVVDAPRLSWLWDCDARLDLRGVTFDAHTLLFASLAILCGYQSVIFAILTKAFAISEGLMPPTPATTSVLGRLTLERGLLAALVALGGGLVLLLAAIHTWRLHHYGALDYAYTMRLVIPGATLTALGFQTMLSSFFLSILRMHRR